jgi:hypothetical protein
MAGFVIFFRVLFLKSFPSPMQTNRGRVLGTIDNPADLRSGQFFPGGKEQHLSLFLGQFEEGTDRFSRGQTTSY